uniref:Uncharacterized protein n=1 Tax=Octopus bimaculoides TaxID=37653 RepID=A0A0L8G3F4_OCTBM
MKSFLLHKFPVQQATQEVPLVHLLHVKVLFFRASKHFRYVLQDFSKFSVTPFIDNLRRHTGCNNKIINETSKDDCINNPM